MKKVFIVILFLFLWAGFIWSCRNMRIIKSAEVELISPEEDVLLKLSRYFIGEVYYYDR